jgi:hypothetical protein
VAPPGSGGGAIPVDTRLDTTATAAALGTTMPGLDAMLNRLRGELDGTPVARAA